MSITCRERTSLVSLGRRALQCGQRLGIKTFILSIILLFSMGIVFVTTSSFIREVFILFGPIPA